MGEGYQLTTALSSCRSLCAELLKIRFIDNVKIIGVSGQSTQQEKTTCSKSIVVEDRVKKFSQGKTS